MHLHTHLEVVTTQMSRLTSMMLEGGTSWAQKHAQFALPLFPPFVSEKRYVASQPIPSVGVDAFVLLRSSWSGRCHSMQNS